MKNLTKILPSSSLLHILTSLSLSSNSFTKETAGYYPVEMAFYQAARSHAAVVPFSLVLPFEVHYLDGSCIREFPFIPGTDLLLFFNSLRITPPKMPVLTNMLKDIGTGLDFIHDNGFLHGDLAKRNIVAAYNRHFYLVDFARARRLDDKPASINLLLKERRNLLTWCLDMFYLLNKEDRITDVWELLNGCLDGLNGEIEAFSREQAPSYSKETGYFYSIWSRMKPLLSS